MSFSPNRKLYKTHQSFWFSNGKRAQSYRIAMYEYDDRIEELKKEGWKLIEPQPKGIFG